MIISAPTALYSSILPQDTDDLRNVTWTISSNDPPRSKTSVLTLLKTEELRPLPARIYDPQQRRVSMGEYVFNLSFSNPTLVGDNTKAFEVGQVIGTNDITETIKQINDLNVPDTVDVQQNTNKLDLSSLGLSDDEIKQLTATATTELQSLIDMLNELLATVNDIKYNISANQKTINENNKALAASKVVFGTDSDIIEKLTAKNISLLDDKFKLINDLNNHIIMANGTYQKILDVREVVR